MNPTNNPVPIVVLAGARPNFMKVAPLMEAFAADSDISAVLVHAGQHYDYSLSGQFFSDLNLAAPDFFLGAGSGSHAQQTAEVMKRFEPVLDQVRPAAVVVVGDVNSTLAGALTAAKLGIRVVHAEAGLRSFDRAMPEEINRVATDAISDLLLVSEESGRANLLRENVAAGRICFTGNLMVDSLRRHLQRAMKSDVRERLSMAGERYGLVTLHRPANVDDQSQLARILEALSAISEELPLHWPMHPRTRTRMAQSGLALPEKLFAVEPLGYLDFLCLEANCAAVLTDSGGVQEESTVLGVPCLTLRENTERPATIEHGTNRLAGTRTETILRAWEESRGDRGKKRIPPLWDGNAAARCHQAIREMLGIVQAAELQAR